MDNKIYWIKLVSGEDLIGELVAQNDKIWQLTKTYQVVMTPNGSLAMIPFPIHGKINAIININANSISCFNNEVHSDLLDRYKASFSDIVTPPKNLVL